MRRFVIFALCLAGVSAVALVDGFFRIDPSGLVLTAARADRSAMSFLAATRLRLMTGCPTEHFAPESPIGFVLNGIDQPGIDTRRLLEVADALITSGCDLDRYNEFGLTALHNAIIFGRPEIVEYLLGNGADSGLRIRLIEGRVIGKSLVGMDAPHLAEHLANRESGSRDRAAIVKILRQPRADRGIAPDVQASLPVRGKDCIPVRQENGALVRRCGRLAQA